MQAMHEFESNYKSNIARSNICRVYIIPRLSKQSKKFGNLNPPSPLSDPFLRFHTLDPPLCFIPSSHVQALCCKIKNITNPDFRTIVTARLYIDNRGLGFCFKNSIQPILFLLSGVFTFYVSINVFGCIIGF